MGNDMTVVDDSSSAIFSWICIRFAIEVRICQFFFFIWSRITTTINRIGLSTDDVVKGEWFREALAAFSINDACCRATMSHEVDYAVMVIPLSLSLFSSITFKVIFKKQNIISTWRFSEEALVFLHICIGCTIVQDLCSFGSIQVVQSNYFPCIVM